MDVAVVGGTFASLHRGHKKLIERACAYEKTVIGLSTDEFASRRKSYGVPPYQERKRNLELFLRSIACSAEILPLSNPFGDASVSPLYDIIVVSEETLVTALKINREREKRSLTPLHIDVVRYELAQDLFPISSRRISSGEIDENGLRKEPVSFSISTRNSIKVEGVKRYLIELGVPYSIFQNTDYTTKDDQPFSEDTLEMARMRARSHSNNVDYSIGIESGLFSFGDYRSYSDFHVCVVLDRYGNETVGTSSGFLIPQYLVDSVKEGNDISAAFEKVHNVRGIGSGEGIVSYYSGKRISRKDLVFESVRNAFIPRLSPGFYGLRF